MSVRHYHNLQGWLRDVIAAADEYERDPGGEGTSLYSRFLDVLYDARPLVGDFTEGDDADDSTDDDSSDVDSGDASLREDDAPRARRPAARSEAHRPAPRGLGRELADVPRSVRSAPEPDVTDVRGGAVGASGLGVRRMQPAVAAQPAEFAPVASRATPRPARKGVSRGKKRTTKKRPSR